VWRQGHRKAFVTLSAVKDGLNKPLLVIPAKAGIQCLQEVAKALDPSLTDPSAVESRWDDGLFRHSWRAAGMTSRQGQFEIPASRASRPRYENHPVSLGECSK
jgi:hypothetical protein